MRHILLAGTPSLQALLPLMLWLCEVCVGAFPSWVSYDILVRGNLATGLDRLSA